MSIARVFAPDARTGTYPVVQRRPAWRGIRGSTREHALTHRQAADLVAAFARFPTQPTTVPLVHAAMASRERFGLSYWDAAIVEAARMLGCDQVLSEDLADGRSYDGMLVVNPFR